jgi:hypothetical protein
MLSKPGYNGLRYNHTLTINIQSKIGLEIVSLPHMYKDVMVMTNKYRWPHSDHYNQTKSAITGFPRYSRGLRSLKILIRYYQNLHFKPKTS